MVSPAHVGGLAVAFGVGAAIVAGGPAASAAPEQPRDSSARPGQTESAAGSSHRSPDTRARNRPSPRLANTATPARASAEGARDPGQPGRLGSRRSFPISTEAAAGALTGPSQRESVSAPAALASAEAPVADGVSVDIPPMPVTHGWSFDVSEELITDYATAYVDGGGDPSDSPRFFFGDLAVASLEALAEQDLSPEQARLELGNLVVSGYFGGIWLRDNLRDTPAASADQISASVAQVPTARTSVLDNLASAITIRLFDVLATTLQGAAAARPSFIVRAANHASEPVLLALYGYNRGYLEVILDNPPPGVPSMKDTLTCEGFLDCNSTTFPLEIANRYDAALDYLAHPTNLRWWGTKALTAVMEGFTGAGRFVWELIASGGLSPTSYVPLVDLSSAYLMISKAAVLSSMLGYANGDTETGRSSLHLQAGLWLWSGSYFAGLASNAPAGTIPSIVVS